MTAKLVFEDGTVFEGISYGAEISRAGEVVFATGMMGYPESLTDPSFQGQILVLTYPLIGNYGVPNRAFWESDTIKVSGLIVSDYIDSPSHYQSRQTLAEWFKDENVPLLELKDTRFLTQKIRTKGAMLGKIVIDKDIAFYDPNHENLVAQVSIKKPTLLRATGKNNRTVVLIDCGAKRNIQQCLLRRNVNVITVPWDFDPFSKEGKTKLQSLLKECGKEDFDALVISNGPGDPKFVNKTVMVIQHALTMKKPTLGICLGHQLLALAAGGDTGKLKFGHRSQNQPCVMEGTKRCYITTQNHGFHVSKVPEGFNAWFTNANDGSNEGIIHKTLPVMSVQFHPEATPGPMDAEWIFDYFLKNL